MYGFVCMKKARLLLLLLYGFWDLYKDNDTYKDDVLSMKDIVKKTTLFFTFNGLDFIICPNITNLSEIFQCVFFIYCRNSDMRIKIILVWLQNQEKYWRCYEGPSYEIAITKLSNEEFLEKDLQVHTSLQNKHIILCSSVSAFVVFEGQSVFYNNVYLSKWLFFYCVS